MNKSLLILLAGVGGMIGSYVPILFGADSLGGWTILGSLVGGLAGIWIGYKLSDF